MPGGHQRVSRNQVRKRLGLPESRSRGGYSRVSSHDQKSDLVSLANRLAGVCDVVIEDLGCGLNCKKPGLRRLLTAILNHEVSTLYVTHKDRLVRFGHELIVQACRWAGTDGVILDDEQDVSFEQELTQDVLTLMTVFSVRLYGRRSHQNRKRVALYWLHIQLCALCSEYGHCLQDPASAQQPAEDLLCQGQRNRAVLLELGSG
ncbi:MAG: IS607 family transposase [Halospina sp.]